MKNYATGLITGILLTASALMLMGVGRTDTTVMRYIPFVIDESVYAMDVRTGKVFENSFAVKPDVWGQDPSGVKEVDNKWKNVCGLIGDRDPLDLFENDDE